MNFARLTVALTIACLYSGCAPPRLEHSFFIRREMFGHNDPSAETLEQIVQSRTFWVNYVAPNVTLPLQEEAQLRGSLRLARGKEHDDQFWRVTLSVSHDSELARNQVAAAIATGLDQYFTKLNGSAKAPYVRNP